MQTLILPPSVTRLFFLSVLLSSALTKFCGVESAAIAAQPQRAEVSVKPDWILPSLTSLMQQYGCGITPSHQSVLPSNISNRYRMAESLNECLNKIAGQFATPADRLAAEALRQELRQEIRALHRRALEAYQFSNSTKIEGEVVLSPESQPRPDLSLRADTLLPKPEQLSPTTIVCLDRADHVSAGTLPSGCYPISALQSLARLYQCVPQSSNIFNAPTIAISRSDMAQSLKGCLTKIIEHPANSKDLAVAKSLQAELQPELAALKNRETFLENQTATLKFQQFSPTTKFQGQAVITVEGGGF